MDSQGNLLEQIFQTETDLTEFAPGMPNPGNSLPADKSFTLKAFYGIYTLTIESREDDGPLSK